MKQEDDVAEMGEPDQIEERRRTLLKLAAMGIPVSSALTAFSQEMGSVDASSSSIVLEQGDQQYEVTPLSTGETVEEFYNLYNAKSHTTTGIEQDYVSELFLFEEPDDLSLVFLHGSGGNTVVFEFSGLPSEGDWVVKDDGHDWGGGEAESDPPDLIEWHWYSGYTDGGAFRGGLTDGFDITIDPDFDADTHFGSGNLQEWQLLSGDAENPERIQLDMDTSVTIRSGASKASLELEDVRLVQTVENTRVGHDSDKINEKEYDGEIDQPPLVADRKTTAAFDLALEGMAPQDWESPVTLTISKDGAVYSESVSLTPATVRKAVENTDGDRSLLDIIMEDKPEKQDDWPLFEVADGEKVTVEISASEDHISGMSGSLNVGSTAWPITDMPELNIGVIRIKNSPDTYGAVADQAYEDAVNNIAVYLQRVFPTTQVNLYREDEKQIIGGDDPDKEPLDDGDNDPYFLDVYDADSFLRYDRTPEDSDSGEIISVKNGVLLPEERTPDKINEFDETLAIVPDQYFDHHDNGNIGGIHLSFDLPGQPATASTADVSKPATTAAMEIGHHFISNQYPKHLDQDVDSEEGVHVDPTVYSTKYSLEPGLLNAEGGVQSFMSDGTKDNPVPASGLPVPERPWTDAYTHRLLIESSFEPVPSIGEGFTDFAAIHMAGPIEAGNIIVKRAIPKTSGFMRDTGTGRIISIVTDSNGNVLDERTLPAELKTSSSGSGGGTFEAILADIPFPEEAYEITFEVEEPDSNEVTTTVVNPVVESFFDAVSRIPASGFTRRPDERRSALNNKLDEVREKMDGKEFQEAKQKLENDFRRMIKRWLKDEYEAAANEYTKQEILELVDDMIARLETLAQSSGGGGR